MAFTETEMAVLSELVYYDDSCSANQCINLKYILNSNINKLRKDLGSQYNDVIDGLIEKCSNNEYSIVLSENDKETGFQAMAIAGPDNEVTVVCRGTEGFNVLTDDESKKDVLNGDYGLITGTGETKQHKQMEMFMDKLQKNGYEKYYFTGHSLGGNLAMYGAIYIADSGKVENVTVFNAPNFNDNFVNNHKKEIEIISSKTIHYQNENDIVSSINGQNVFGNVIICKSLDDNNNPFDFNDHMLYSFDIDGTKKIVVSDKGKSEAANISGDVATHGDTILKVSATYGIVKILSGATIVSSAGTVVVMAVSLVVTVAVISYAVNFIKKWLFKNSVGYQKAVSNPYIEIDTNLLRIHAKELKSISGRAKHLDGKMNDLYWHVGFDWNAFSALKNLGSLLQAEYLLEFAKRLDKCSDYLNNTADSFDNVEKELSSYF